MASYNGKRKSRRIGSDQKVKEQSVETVREVKWDERIDYNARGDMKTENRKVQAKIGLGEIIVRRIQGRHFLVEISDEELIELLRQTEWSYLKDFFIKIEPWLEKLKIKERVSWIEVSGVPLYCWNYETCKRVAGLWGKLASIGKNLTKVHNFEKIELLISITQLNLIDEVVSLEVGDVIFPIRLEKKVEDSISKAGSVVSTRPKIPSEGIENVKSRGLMVVNLENGNKSNKCQKMLEVENEEVESEHVSKEINLGVADETDNGLERALKDVRDMGLGVVEDDLKVSKDRGIKNGSHVGRRNAGISIFEDLIGLEEGFFGWPQSVKDVYEWLQEQGVFVKLVGVFLASWLL
ncbi:hypothetical protein PVK06_029973 [Gossypium arboreum]|uniref:DUF4283 domain-containing protein n=1 Tax=Gossypium arboreum TaxID=29729 RepID=A0ABR0NMI7_GOSAR|nr:hypothetical protein PVK06_029973 [Gossypium arboreum]